MASPSPAPRPLSMFKKTERLKRSVNQTNIKLISKDNYGYVVCGSTGSLYTIMVDDSGINCSCIDCKRNKNYCKHIYFIFLNVYGFIPELDRVYNVEELKTFHDTKRESTKKARNELEDCPICFECVSTNYFTCSTCENGFHDDCIKTLLKFSTRCPMCRHSINAYSNFLDKINSM